MGRREKGMSKFTAKISAFVGTILMVSLLLVPSFAQAADGSSSRTIAHKGSSQVVVGKTLAEQTKQLSGVKSSSGGISPQALGSFGTASSSISAATFFGGNGAVGKSSTTRADSFDYADLGAAFFRNSVQIDDRAAGNPIKNDINWQSAFASYAPCGTDQHTNYQEQGEHSIYDGSDGSLLADEVTVVGYVTYGT